MILKLANLFLLATIIAVGAANVAYWEDYLHLHGW